MSKPVRIRLDRNRGFNLQASSIAINGLPAVNVARPSKWGNPVKQSDFTLINAILVKAGRQPIGGTWQEHAVKCFDAWLGGEIPELGEPLKYADIQKELHGKNLACWCPPDGLCHADILLRIACDEVRS